MVLDSFPEYRKRAHRNDMSGLGIFEGWLENVEYVRQIIYAPGLLGRMVRSNVDQVNLTCLSVLLSLCFARRQGAMSVAYLDLSTGKLTSPSPCLCSSCLVERRGPHGGG